MRVRLIRNTVIGVGLTGTAGQEVEVEALVAAALLQTRAAELVRPADLAGVNQAQERENKRVSGPVRRTGWAPFN